MAAELEVTNGDHQLSNSAINNYFAISAKYALVGFSRLMAFSTLSFASAKRGMASHAHSSRATEIAGMTYGFLQPFACATERLLDSGLVR